MPLIVQMRPVAVGMSAAFKQFKGVNSRICRLSVLFPDIGSQPVALEVGFLRYWGESSVVKPEATEQELSLLPGLTIHL